MAQIANFEEGTVTNGDVELHYIADGPADGEPVLLLHGFPQYSYMWRNQLPALAGAGYRAIAPDLRGYHKSGRPEGIERYAMKELMSDIGAFYKAFGWQKANLVVHDWGAIIGWPFVAYNQAQVDRLVVIDCPHPAAYGEVIREGVEQMYKSWYIWFFQTQGVPEQYFGGPNIERLMQWCFLSTQHARETFTPEDLQKYREMLLQPGQLTAAFNYYRANFQPERLLAEPPTKYPAIETPTLLIYGKDDLALSSRGWKKTAKFVSGPYRSVELEGIGHWAAEEAPEEVNRLILEHLAS